MPALWQKQQLFLCSILLQCAEACIDSSGDFYCTSLWYFWFGLFWFCMLLFIGTVCIVNRCKKRKARVDIQIQLPPVPRTSRDKGNEALANRTETSEV